MTSTAGQYGQVWERFWFRETPPHLLALFRIAFGSFLLFYWGLRLSNVTMIFSSDGVLLPAPLPYLPETLSFLLIPPAPSLALLLFILFLLSLLCITLGFLFHSSCATALLLYLYYWMLSLHHLGATYDRLFLFTLLVLLFSGADRTLSLSMLFKKGSPFAWEPISILPQRLLAVQISATYLGVGVQKFILPLWQGGEVLSYSFITLWATPLSFAIARLHLPIEVYDLVVWVVKIFEILLPFGLWIRELRTIAVIGVALFLCGVAAFLSLWPFLVLIPACIVFWEPEEVYRKMKNVEWKM